MTISESIKCASKLQKWLYKSLGDVDGKIESRMLLLMIGKE